MRIYEKDTELKIPKIYYKIPLKVLDCLCDIGLAINRLLPQAKDKNANKEKNKRNVKFYL